MLLTMQIPVADARCFVEAPTGQLAIPGFPQRSPSKDFVRSFGQMRARARGGLEGWGGEEVYARALNGLRFEGNVASLRRPGKRSYPNWGVAFRRLLSDGRATSRFEIGLSERNRSFPWKPWECYPDFAALVDDILELQVKVRTTPPQDFVPSALGASNHFLAKHYLRSTTRIVNKQRMPVEPWWCTAGVPLLFIEMRGRDLAGAPSLPPTATIVDAMPELERLTAEPVVLAHLRHQWRDRSLGVWIVQWDRGAPPDLLRRLRLHLLRLHAEREVYRMMLALLSDRTLQVEKGSTSDDRIQRYLLTTTSRLDTPKREGLAQPEIIEAAYAADRLMTSGQWAGLLETLDWIRPNILRLLRESKDRDNGRPPPRGHVRMLFVGTHPGSADNQSRLDVEMRSIDEQVRLSGGSIEIKQAWATRPSDLPPVLLEFEPHIVHFSGHGTLGGEIMFDDDSGTPRPVHVDQLAEVFSTGLVPVRCVVLNACYTAASAKTLTDAVDCVIGTDNEISEESAIEFAAQLYSALGRGTFLDAAFDWGRAAVGLIDRNDQEVLRILPRPGVDPGTIRFA